jgi:acyl-coenzyme A thioesterase PaaI-like protein
MDGGGGEATDARLVLVTEGPWAGWSVWPGDPYEDVNGPFYYRKDEAGRARMGFIAEQRHMNGHGTMHGGCVMTFADYCLFMIGHNEIPGLSGVTVSLNGEFVGAVPLGARTEATGEVVKAGGSLVFVRGLITADGAPAMSFSGVIKKLKPKA